MSAVQDILFLFGLIPYFRRRFVGRFGDCATTCTGIEELERMIQASRADPALGSDAI
jgi:hypothetical protein